MNNCFAYYSARIIPTRIRGWIKKSRSSDSLYFTRIVLVYESIYSYGLYYKRGHHHFKHNFRSLVLDVLHIDKNPKPVCSFQNRKGESDCGSLPMATSKILHLPHFYIVDRKGIFIIKHQHNLYVVSL